MNNFMISVIMMNIEENNENKQYVEWQEMTDYKMYP